MKTVQEIFNAAMGLMDELSVSGEAGYEDTKEHEYRTPGWNTVSSPGGKTIINEERRSL